MEFVCLTQITSLQDTRFIINNRKSKVWTASQWYHLRVPHCAQDPDTNSFSYLNQDYTKLLGNPITVL